MSLTGLGPRWKRIKATITRPAIEGNKKYIAVCKNHSTGNWERYAPTLIELHRKIDIHLWERHTTSFRGMDDLWYTSIGQTFCLIERSKKK